VKAAALDGIGPGRLVLVVGPSGAGKDTLMRLAQPLSGEATFALRTVTRASSESEANEALSRAEFDAARAEGAFAFHWDAHGLSYGVRHEINADLQRGISVVVNVSRAVVKEVKTRYNNVIVVLITAPPDVLAGRLAQRQRQSDGPLQERLRRKVDESEFIPDVTIINVGDPMDGARDLARVIKD